MIRLVIPSSFSRRAGRRLREIRPGHSKAKGEVGDHPSGGREGARLIGKLEHPIDRGRD